MEANPSTTYLVKFGSLCLVEESELKDSAILSGGVLRPFDGFAEEVCERLNNQPFVSEVTADIDWFFLGKCTAKLIVPRKIGQSRGNWLGTESG